MKDILELLAQLTAEFGHLIKNISILIINILADARLKEFARLQNYLALGIEEGKEAIIFT